jgi:hypothetical protein
MKPTVFTILLVLPVFCFSQYTYKNLQVNFLENSEVVKNYTYENLRLYPVYAKDSFKILFKNIGNYKALQEAIQKNEVKITEKPSGGSVNDLTIENISSDTIIIICGDVVKGGQQDRIIQEDIVLAPKSGKKNLKVFCVESGRWSRSDRNYSTSSDVIIKENKPAEFNAYFNKGSMSLRKVVEKEKDQSKVWSKVEEINTANKTQTSTKTYTAITTSDNFNKKLDAYIKFFHSKLVSDPNIIGVVVVTGNMVLGCDLFATNSIWKGQMQSLLHSYATEAILNGKPVTIAAQTLKNYTDKLLKDEATQKLTLKEKGTSFTSNGKKIRVSSFD